jgi:phosphate transport system substrate-binding protein
LRSSKRRLAWIVALLAAVGLVAAACGSDDSGSSSDTTTSGGATTASAGVDYGSLSGTLNGSGSTFQKTFDEAAIASFADVAPGLTVNYQGVGSGQGKKDLAAGTVEWAGTDSKVSDADMGNYPGGILYFPTVAAPITVSYNLSGVDEVKLSPDTLAGIFMGQITTWDDPKIAADNPGTSLPSTAVTVAVRSDGSGTTSAFSKYLAKASPSVFTLTAGDTVEWPKSTAGKGNPGVAQIISQTDGAIGYVDYSDAKASGLTFAAIKNKSGDYVQPTLDAASAALEGATVGSDLFIDALDASGADAYPITSGTYVLITKVQKDQATADNLEGWITYLLTDAQGLANDADFATLPTSLADQALAQLDQITVG